MGLDIYLYKHENGMIENEEGDITGGTIIEINSSKYPEHYFKIGYFRSSYNESGINGVLRNSIGTDLDTLFNPKKEYAFKPDWTNVRAKVADAAAKYEYWISKTPFRISKLRFHSFAKESMPDSESKAMEIFLKTKSRLSTGSFSCSEGTFYLDKPFEMIAAIPGTNYGEPCTYAVYKDSEASWYLEALEIILETCDWVLAQPDVEKYHLHWSS